MRRAAKVDANQAEIVAALRRVGCSVQSLADVGRGVPDLLVARGGKNLLMEIKRERGGRLTLVQKQWLREWRGSVYIIRTVEEALQCVGLQK